jgi:non-specific serine/threonine protein kinase
VQLFVGRAQAVRPDFSLTEENVLDVAEICARLDGLPLAIELAAARVKLLTPRAMLKQLSEAKGQKSLRLLTGGARDAPERHRALKDTIAWSYELLTPHEQTLFRRLSVFTGGFSLAAVDAVCTPSDLQGSPLPPLELAIMDEIPSLMDKSLLRQEGEIHGEPRFAMLTVVREYAREWSDIAGETPVLNLSHASFFRDFAQKAHAHLEKEDQAEWLEILDAEHANLRAALRWSLGQEDGVIAAGLGIPLSLFWLMRGHLTEGRDWLEEILAVGGLQENRALYADVLDRAGFLASYQSDHEGAVRLIEASLAIRRESGDRHRIADSLALLGFVRLRQEHYRTAADLNKEALEIHREIHNAQGVADALSNLSIIAFHQGDLPSARPLIQESLEIWEKLGDKQGVAWASNLLGKVDIQNGDLQAAKSHYLNSLKLAEEIGHRWGLAFSLEGMASLAATEARWEKALVLAGGAAAIRYAIGLPLSPADKSFYDRTLQPAYRNLTELEAEQALRRGRNMSVDALVAFAVDRNPAHRSLTRD